MEHHDLKTWPEYFTAVQINVKQFEVRKDDRDFQVGDILHLHEYDPILTEYTDEVCHRKITYKLEGGSFGVEEGYCILGIEPTK